MIKIIIAGGRDFTDSEGLLETFDEFVKDIPNSQIIILSGGARGADTIGEWIASQYGITVEIYPADWDRYGASAGYRRNEVMAKNATHLLAAWDGQSKGTKHMIDLGKTYNLVTQIYHY